MGRREGQGGGGRRCQPKLSGLFCLSMLYIDMAQTREGAATIAAKKAGITIEEYQARHEAGEKWCSGCRAWHSHDAFGKDRSRWDGLAAYCRDSRNTSLRSRYKPKPGPESGRAFVPARAGDKKQARRRINYFVEAGLLPHPNLVPCTDCGNVWSDGDSRHEYDHYLGYAAVHHEHVQAVCAPCHHKREPRYAN